MASKPRRRWSRELPPDLSELMNKLQETGTSFNQEFNTREPWMRVIVEDFLKISEKVKQMQGTTDNIRTGGAVGLGLVIVAAPFTGGLSLAAAGGGIVAATAAVVGANVKKMLSESGSAKEAEELGEEFKWIVEPLKGILEEIKETCEKLEEKAAEDQSGKALTNMEEFEKILRRVSELKVQSSGALNVATLLIQTMKNLLILMVRVFRVTATPEKDRELRDAITQSADQSQKVTDEFEKMKTLLEEILHW